MRRELFSNRLLKLAAILTPRGGFVKEFTKVIRGGSDPDHTDEKRFIKCILITVVESEIGAEQNTVTVYSG
jgi:hypothetical protein